MLKLANGGHAGDDPVRALNQSIAKAYDEVVFERPARSLVDPEAVFGLSAIYGGVPAGRDVLDLGCGTGVQLDAVGDTMGGRLVGIDISAEAVARARTRCARFGARADIRRADFLDLGAQDLGQFDLIYILGVLYVIPPDVRAHLLELIARCLKPGGVAVVSYYAGTWYLVRASIARLLCAMDDKGAPVPDRIAAARRRIEELLSLVPAQGEQRDLARAVLRQLSETADDVLFHEALNPAFEVLDTPALAAGMARHGVQFLGYMRGGWGEDLPSPRDRALAAAKYDFSAGGYRFAAFCRLPEGAAGVDMRAPAVRWTSTLTRQQASGDAVVYSDGKVAIRTDTRQTQALLDAFERGPVSWDEICSAVRPTLNPGSLEAEFQTLAKELGKLWQYRFVCPLRPLDGMGGPSPDADG